jgi:hypothetical protein
MEFDMGPDEEEKEGFFGGLLDTVEHGLEAVVDVAGHGIDMAGNAVEAAGGWAVNEVAAVGMTAYHAGVGVYDAATGDWDGAADQMADMSNSAVNFLSGGALGAAEAVVDLDATARRAGGASDEEAPTSSDTIHGGLKAAGEWIGDKVYDLVHPDE